MNNEPKKKGRPKKVKSLINLDGSFFSTMATMDTQGIVAIQTYCKEIGLTPEELIKSHKDLIRGAITGVVPPKTFDAERKKFFNDEYDPFKNPRFNNKIGKKND